jgi:hypothetical protein
MKVKTSDLIGPALDWAVGAALGYTRSTVENLFDRKGPSPAPAGFWVETDPDAFGPSADWAQGGPIIDREQIETAPWDTEEAADRKPYGFAATSWRARNLREYMYDAEGHFGPTPLIAAMRCFVASKLGDEVDIPEELLS